MRSKKKRADFPGPSTNNAGIPRDFGVLTDAVAIGLQRLHQRRKLDTEQPLLSVDYRREAAVAPFQFDAARALLHRTGCKAIPRSSRSALYGVWTMTDKDMRVACPRCHPMPRENKPERPFDLTDVFFGLISLVDQFGSVLYERGKEYRGTVRGKQMERSFSGLIANLDQKQRQGMTMIMSAMDSVLSTLNSYNQTVGRDGNTNGKRPSRRRKKR